MRQPAPPVRPPRRHPLRDATPRDLLGPVRDAADAMQTGDVVVALVDGIGSAAGAVADLAASLSDLSP